MSDTIPYSQYGAPAQFIERSWPHSSDGPMPPRKTGCLSKHWLTPQTDTVHPQRPHAPEPDRVRLANSPDPALAAVQTSSIEARYLDPKAKGDADVPALWASLTAHTRLAVRDPLDSGTTAPRRTAPRPSMARRRPAAALGSAPSAATTD